MKIIGILFVLWGIADFGLSWAGVDLYNEIGITVSDELWPFTHWIAGGIGAAIYAIGKSRE
ncbi:MAG: hypothetical protein CL782_06355 [Chloroflexi bacterium]|nr:hypothetical protein [Chloroflexota bacterium]|tara:strand:- start:1018 stop:1200 length:183 start_codon:yes stop_codon:yes gene_type:complete